MTLLRYFSQAFLAILIFWLGMGASTASAQTEGAQNADSTLTADVLQDTLYAKTDAEIRYCTFVIDMRDQKILPNRLLYYSYKKAMQQDKSRRFTYFQKYLETACNSQGIVLAYSEQEETKKLFIFNNVLTKSAKTTSTAPALAKPATQNTQSKPFAFLHRLFVR